ncbi:MAG: TonB-dependent receptor [Opitutus sp.]
MHSSLNIPIPSWSRSVVLIATAFLLLAISPEVIAADRQTFDIPAGAAEATLRQFSAQANGQFVFSAGKVEGVRTHAVKGEFTAREALGRMVADTELRVVQDERTGALTVDRVASSPPDASPSKPGTGSPNPGRNAAAAPNQGEGVIRGQVRNEVTDDFLYGAVIEIVGTNQVVTTARDGTFRLPPLPAGPVELSVSYTGLTPKHVTVDVQSGQPTNVDVALTSDIYVLPEFTVAGQREGNALAITQQRQAPNLITIVASDAFGNIGRQNIGDFLQRLPGVVGNHGNSDIDNVSVRGMDSGLTSIQVDGTREANAAGGRGQRVDQMPVGVIDIAEIIKAPTPDSDADSLGGVINLRTKSALDRRGRHIDFTFGGTHNITFGDHIMPDKDRWAVPSFNASYSDKFSIFGGEDNLGMLVIGNYNKYQVAHGSITSGGFDSDWDFQSEDFEVVPDHTYHQGNLQVRKGLSVRLDYRPNADSKYTFSVGQNQFQDTMVKSRNGFDDEEFTGGDAWVATGEAKYTARQDQRWRDSETWRAWFAGENRIGEFKIDYDVNASSAHRDEQTWISQLTSEETIEYTWERPRNSDWPIFTQTGGLDIVSDERFEDSVAEIEREDFTDDEDIIGSKFNVARSFDTRHPFGIKAGVRYRYQKSAQDEDLPIVAEREFSDNSAFIDPRWTFGGVNGRYPVMPVPSYAALASDVVQNPQDYDFDTDEQEEAGLENDNWVREDVTAAYLQADMRINRLRMLGGVRLEETRVKGDIPVENSDEDGALRWSERAIVKGSYRTWFPSAHFRFDLTPSMVLTSSYSTTIGRPGFGDIAGTIEPDHEDFEVDVGNPSLKPQYSKNYDLSIEYYFEPAGMLSLGVFHKEISDYIADSNYVVPDGPGNGFDGRYAGYLASTKTNLGSARVQGLEFSYIQQFSFLPGRWKGLGVNLNFTLLSTEGDYGEDVETDKLEDFRPFSGNIGLNYNYGRLGFRIQANYVDEYVTGLVIDDMSETEYKGARNSVDVLLKYQVTPRITAFADFLNILQTPFREYQGEVSRLRQYRADVTDMLVTAGIRASF